MGGNYGDLDNDGVLDLYLGTAGVDYCALLPNRMFRNVRDKYFQDVTTSAGVGRLDKGQAISFGDIDNDGNEDIYAVFGGVYPGDTCHRALFKNPGHRNHWLKLKLEGVRSNRTAIGARIRVTVYMKKRRTRDIWSTVSIGSSFGSSSLLQNISLGRAISIRAVAIIWPVGREFQRFVKLKMTTANYPRR